MDHVAFAAGGREVQMRKRKALDRYFSVRLLVTSLHHRCLQCDGGALSKNRSKARLYRLRLE